MVQLPGFSPGEPAGSALTISPDGSAIAGYSFRRTSSGRTQEAAIWKGSDVSLLGHLAGGRFTTAYGISTDGKVVVGHGVDLDGFGAAFRWTERSGMKPVAELLAMGGIDMTGWRLILATSVSSDGSVIVGQAMNPSGLREDFVAIVPVDFVPEPNSMALIVSAACSLVFCNRQFAATKQGRA